jgi:hypothetical protein
MLGMKLAAAIGMLGVLCATIGGAHAMQFDRTVPSGTSVSMHRYRSWGRTCEVNGGQAKLLTRPQHGKLTTRTVDSRIEINRFAHNGSTRCTGRPIKAFEVNYRSNPGYHGPDSFTIEFTSGNGQRDTDTYTVNVQ